MPVLTERIPGRLALGVAVSLWLAPVDPARAAVPAGVLPLFAATSQVPPELSAACRPFAEGLSLCFSVSEKGTRRSVNPLDLQTWKVSLAEVEAGALQAARGGLGPDRPGWVTVEGDTRRYLLSAEGDGLDHAGLLDPSVLVERLAPSRIAVGVPAQGVLIAFGLGDPEMEKIVTVGIRRVWETQPDPVTPVVFTWTGSQWVPWAEASPGPAPSAPR